jgi:hypothetical protein
MIIFIVIYYYTTYKVDKWSSEFHFSYLMVYRITFSLMPYEMDSLKKN